MKRGLKIAGVIILIAVIVVGLAVLNFAYRGGAFATLTPHFDGTCTAVETGGDSAEDIVIDRERGFAYLSALDRRGLVSGKEVKGTITRIDLKAETWTVAPALESAPSDLHPHGMSLFIAPDGARRLFVLSHPRGKPHTVEMFDATEDGRWRHAGTVRDTLLIDPNDLAAVGLEQVYVGNDSGASNGAERAAEMMFGLNLSTLAYYNGERSTPAVRGMSGAGGVAVSGDGRHLFVAETMARQIQVYGREPATGALTPLHAIPLAGGPDNIDIAPDGSLWVAAHPNTIALVRHFGSGSPAPTQVFRIAGAETSAPQVTEVYLNVGGTFSAGSVAAVYEDKVLMGSITEPKVQVCTLPAGAPQ
jgi:arylesterase/paraoxonase